MDCLLNDPIPAFASSHRASRSASPNRVPSRETNEMLHREHVSRIAPQATRQTNRAGWTLCRCQVKHVGHVRQRAALPSNLWLGQCGKREVRSVPINGHRQGGAARLFSAEHPTRRYRSRSFAAISSTEQGGWCRVTHLGRSSKARL